MRTSWLATALLASALLPACSDDSTPPPRGELSATEAGPGDGPRAERGREGGAVDSRRLEAQPPRDQGIFTECDAQGNRLRLTFVVKGYDLTSTDVKAATSSKGIIGFTGTASTWSFWLGRAGEPTAGAFDHSGVYHATTAPYHLLLQLWPTSSGSQCAGNSKCESYYGLNGDWLILTDKAPTAGTFLISSLTTQQGCWVEQPSGPPDTKGCSIVGGTLFGCFKVN